MTALAAVLLAGVTVMPSSGKELQLAPILATFREPLLEDMKPDARVFRFIYLPPFPAMRRFLVRVEHDGYQPVLSYKAAQWSYEGPSQLVISDQRAISEAAWQALADLRQAGFWQFRPVPYPRTDVTDGAVWVLEGAAGGERLRLVQHAPDASAFTELALAMFRLSGIKPRPAEQETRLFR